MKMDTCRSIIVILVGPMIDTSLGCENLFCCKCVKIRCIACHCNTSRVKFNHIASQSVYTVGFPSHAIKFPSLNTFF